MLVISNHLKKKEQRLTCILTLGLRLCEFIFLYSLHLWLTFLPCTSMKPVIFYIVLYLFFPAQFLHIFVTLSSLIHFVKLMVLANLQIHRNVECEAVSFSLCKDVCSKMLSAMLLIIVKIQNPGVQYVVIWLNTYKWISCMY